MHFLVIGGTRFIGPHVVARLTASGHKVTVFHRGQAESVLPGGVEHIHGDRRELPGFRPVFEKLAPDAVIDMVPLTEPDARSVVLTFKGLARRLVAVSSQDVYRAYGRLRHLEPGPPDPVPLREEAPLRERLFPYRGSGGRLEDYEKILVERVVMGQPDLPGTVLRLPMVYGPGDYQHRLFDYLKRMDDGRPFILLERDEARWRWTRGYVEDIAAAIALAAVSDRAAGRIYNVGEPTALTLAEWVTRIGRVAGWTGRVVTLPRERMPAHLLLHIDPSQDLVADTSRIRVELGYSESVSQDEALRRTVDWERAHPPAQIDPSHFDYAAEDAVVRAI